MILIMIPIKEYVERKKVILKDYFSTLKKKPVLVIVQVNDDEASNAYIRGKVKDCAEVGVTSRLYHLPMTTSQDELLSLMDKFNKDNEVDAYIVQLPLPDQIDEKVVKNFINPRKDVDGFSPLSELTPATPKGIIEYLKDNNFVFQGKNAVILGRSNIVGKPMQKALLDLNMNVLNLHSKTTDEDRKFYIEHADLVVVAIGKKYYLDNRFNFKKDCYVIDVGINREDGHLYGDCAPDLKVAYQSPVPGGVGLLTRLALLINLKELIK
jgi:5,10-methylene-tetrahydrofolate dehydrogenase/Methenyl tetrahydrofolate cyclohydrolase